MTFRPTCLPALLLALACNFASANAAPDLRSLIAAGAPQRATRPYDERDWMERFYAPRAYAPAWSGQAAQGVALLQEAAAYGLAPADYQAETLARQLRDAKPEDAQRFDVALTQAMLRYLADLRVGRVRSEYHGALPDPRLQAFDPVERLRAALAEKKLGGAVDAAQPRLTLYQRVRSTLADYRKLAQTPHAALPPLAANKLEAGGAYDGAPALRARLLQLGDLGGPGAAAMPATLYTPDLVQAVKRFQGRHGLTPDGVIGRETLATLNVPLAQRVRQLELTLERLRWLPDFGTGRAIGVNLPSYRLWGFESGAVADTQTVLEMRVIVGTAVKTETPLFIGALRYLEFNPYWNVPRSIERAEIIPKLVKDPGYLAKHEMELVPLAGGAPVVAVDAEVLAGLRAGQYRVRQRPGPANALGAVKFAMPNPMNIYLHSTSARELFKRSRRDLSHGCIRVERPAELAHFVLGEQPQWTDKAVEAAMAPGVTRTVSLKKPIPVVLFYATAVTERSGQVLFAPDIYQRDAALERALGGTR